jgi:ubiquinone/menaquinone biosynthesis C-methylase UbiE
MHDRRFNPQNFARLRSPERQALLEVDRAVNLALEGIHAKTALDVGSGSGMFAELLAQQGLEAEGVDVSPEMIAAAQEMTPGVTFRQSAAELLPYPDASFDLIFMGVVLHETDDALAALKEAHRVAVQRVAILEWRDEDQSFGPPRSDRISAEKMRSLAVQAGFSQIEAIRLQNLVLYRLTPGDGDEPLPGIK